jgi:hypothetical protein
MTYTLRNEARRRKPAERRWIYEAATVPARAAEAGHTAVPAQRKQQAIRVNLLPVGIPQRAAWVHLVTAAYMALQSPPP